VILLIGIVGMVIAWFYTAPPIRFGHRSGLGELVCVLGCGPVIALGAYYVQAREFSWPVLWASLPIGLLMGLVLLLNEFHDVEADGRVGKRTLVVVLGARGAAWVVAVTLGLSFVLIAALAVLGVLPGRAPFALAALPLGVFVAVRVLRAHSDTRRLLPANLALIVLHVTVTAVLTAAALVH
jgi:1,4-dihydroxy-2-naphthoate octaprenyltransferase